ncbi:MAG: enhanced serine sensitivity protein SseB C-terminal domain-containing protein [Oscillospiraceae bacterium]|nr:enhanced serine sensitivity protein SseB C-terminal domain-containing protein [Oscillospiraceae bacterium]
MPSKFKINDPLDPQMLHQFLIKRRSVSESDTEEVNQLMNAIAAEIVMNARFICAVKFSSEPQKQKDGTYLLDDNAQISFLLLENEQFGKIFPIFTDESELKKCDAFSDYYTVIADFDGISGMIADGNACAGMMINPFDDNMFISRNVVSKWREKKQILQTGRASHVITDKTPLDIHAPNPYPMQLSNKLCEIAKTIPEVNALWLRGVTLNGDEGYMLVIEAPRAERFFDSFGSASKDFIGNKSLHVIPSDGELGKRATQNVVPIYSKE